MINPSSVIRSRLCKGCYGDGRSKKFKPLVLQKNLHPPVTGKDCPGGSIFLKKLVFSIPTPLGHNESERPRMGGICAGDGKGKKKNEAPPLGE